MLEFLKEYWQFISTGLVLIFVLILSFIKKRPVAEILDDSAYSTIINLVKEAESLFGAKKGKKKLEYVVNHYTDLVQSESGSNLVAVLEGSVSKIVDDILSTPEKKKKGGC